MLLASLLLLTGYLIFLLWEKRENDRALRSFRHVIHVSGIRGKTGVCRLLDAHLRGAGYRVFTKTTGSVPAYIDTDGVERAVRRRGMASIGEQLAMIRQASREGAEILILECMAVRPDLQRVSQREMVKGDVNVITNVRYDHIFEMGETLEDIAGALAGVLPAGGALFTADEAWFPYFQERCQVLGSQAFLCRGETGEEENQAVARAVGAYLGVPPETFPDHIRACRRDFGARHLYRREDGQVFVNLFSANDPQSTRALLERYLPDLSEAVLLYNNRADRPDRLLLFARRFFPGTACGKVLVMGESRSLACRLLRRAGCPSVEPVKDWRAALAAAEGAPLAGVGNIKGQAARMVAWFEERGDEA